MSSNGGWLVRVILLLVLDDMNLLLQSRRRVHVREDESSPLQKDLILVQPGVRCVNVEMRNGILTKKCLVQFEAYKGLRNIGGQ